MIRIGDRVQIWPHYHSFVGCHGAVTQVKPLMVRLDEYSFSMRIEESAIVAEERREHWAGAE
jgi:hypothetical protein